ncbi:uncharacterized protein [Aegilops tauschii subsp. strangulata]|uniref:Uncharacterized protein n=1 Tax=Aegilops tauschii subsp. strangulata TaxID=200361 RepID=A0A453HNP7_AEGTS|nr:uncharacterized protein LOC109737050 isoform X1 [Aegilops tauschii subsp. strangulata]XP_044377773.1 uncharacterized protein LOC123099737 isoform X1 [Triticum aestivum]
MEKEILAPSLHTVQTFMDGHAELRDIPSEYRWQEDKGEMKADEYHGLSYNKALAKFLSDKEQNYMASTSATILGETMDLVKPLCTKDDVFRVRVEMHRAKESYTKEETLFKSEARQDELLIDPNLTAPCCYDAMSNGLSATSYAHFFHKLPSKESVENGAYKKMICKELNKLFPRRTRLYMHFLKMKIETAEKHGVISKGTCEALDKRRFCIAP